MKNKKESRFLCQDTENNVKRPKKWFIRNVWMDVYVRVLRRVYRYIPSQKWDSEYFVKNSNLCIQGIT